MRDNALFVPYWWCCEGVPSCSVDVGDMFTHVRRQGWCVYLLVCQRVQGRHSDVEQGQDPLKRRLGGKPHVELQQIDLRKTHRNHLRTHNDKGRFKTAANGGCLSVGVNGISHIFPQPLSHLKA